MRRWLANLLRQVGDALNHLLKLVCFGFALGLGIYLAALFLWTMTSLAHAESIPAEAVRYRSTLIRCARIEWGMDAPMATMAAQAHQESRWRADAVSPVGARGLGQIMPATAAWLCQVNGWGDGPQPYNPAWSLRALASYDRWLWVRVDGATSCDRMAMTLSAYNGGLGWTRRDIERAERLGLDPLRWWDNVEAVNAGRSPAAWKENRGYPRRILRDLEPLYLRAGWGTGVCQ